MKRARGSGGRFLNTKQLHHHHHQQQQLQSSVNTGLGNVSGCNLRSENAPVSSTATPTSSDVTSVSASGGMFGQHDHLGFLSTDFHSPVSGSAQGGGIMGNGSQPRITIVAAKSPSSNIRERPTAFSGESRIVRRTSHAWEPAKSPGDRRFRRGPSDDQVSDLENSSE